MCDVLYEFDLPVNVLNIIEGFCSCKHCGSENEFLYNILCKFPIDIINIIIEFNLCQNCKNFGTIFLELDETEETCADELKIEKTYYCPSCYDYILEQMDEYFYDLCNSSDYDYDDDNYYFDQDYDSDNQFRGWDFGASVDI